MRTDWTRNRTGSSLSPLHLAIVVLYDNSCAQRSKGACLAVLITVIPGAHGNLRQREQDAEEETEQPGERTRTHRNESTECMSGSCLVFHGLKQAASTRFIANKKIIKTTTYVQHPG
ncbi:hypothetical protein [Billgrantia kenyensis]|uniref:Uncharacterized protein n=1 Tax=Billgrantia kenyensis TaxID=321266 RepID=A0A7V9W208_9GAMM|nr:hypothetical protein [Halomonas kenyensis]MBA2779570.1 hypothetical protein [Halomonas kenyensis]MCG6662282.1 hypothetical protein [Halomonas kenyensis]